MTREELLVILNEVLPDLLQPSIDVLLGDVKTYMTEVVNPLSDKIESLGSSKEAGEGTDTQAPEKTTNTEQDSLDEDSATEPPTDTDMSNDPLIARVKLLEQKLADAEAAKAKQDADAKDMRFSSTLSAELDKMSPLHKSVVQELLSSRLRSKSEETETGWLSDGQTLGETVKSFFASPEGMHFLPSQHVNGVGVTEPKPPKTGDNRSTTDKLMEAFG